MKKTLLLSTLGLLAFGAGAQEVGQVLSSVPVVQQVAVPRQVCQPQAVVVEQQPSGAGGVLGAIAGAAVGSQIGGGSGRGVATVLGTLGGAVLGNNIEGGQRQVQTVQNCTTQTYYENRTVGYNVTYEYAGRQYTAQMPQDPGPTVRLQVTPVGAADYGTPPMSQGVPVQGGGAVVAPPMGYPAPVMAPPAVYPAPAYPVPAYPAYPVYRPSSYYAPPIGLSLNFGYSRGWHHR